MRFGRPVVVVDDHGKCKISHADVQRLVPSGMKFDRKALCLQVRKPGFTATAVIECVFLLPDKVAASIRIRATMATLPSTSEVAE